MKYNDQFKRGESKELFVILHAYQSSPKKLKSIQKLIENKRPNADIYIPSLSTSIFSTAKVETIVQELLHKIDELYEVSMDQRNEKVQSGYRKITLIGHSIGALFARKLYVCACGELEQAPFEDGILTKGARPWADKIDRIILLAGMNRGWQISHHRSLSGAFLWSLGTLLGNIISLFSKSKPLIFSVRQRGSFYNPAKNPMDTYAQPSQKKRAWQCPNSSAVRLY